MRVDIEDVDLASPDELVAWNDLMRRGYNATREAAWWRSAEAVVAQYTNPKPGRVTVALRALMGGQPVGGAEANADPGESVDVEIAVLPEFRRRGVGRALALAVRDGLSAAIPETSPTVPETSLTVPEMSVRFPETSPAIPGPVEPSPTLPETSPTLPEPVEGLIFFTEVYSDEGVAFAQACGLEVANQEVRQLLDWPVSEDHIASINRMVDEIRVESWTGACPEEFAQELARLTTQMGEDVPLGELSRKATATEVADLRQNEQRMMAQGYVPVTSLALARERAVGYTTIYLDTNSPEIMIQDDTLVDRDYRGRGVARALKAANLRKLATLPQAMGAKYLQTYTSPDNKPMLALNKQVGFWTADVMTALQGGWYSAGCAEKRSSPGA